MILRSFKRYAGCKLKRLAFCLVRYTNSFSRLSPTQIQKLLNLYLVADYEQPISGEVMKAVVSQGIEKNDGFLLAPVDMEDSGPYEIPEPRVMTAPETCFPFFT